MSIEKHRCLYLKNLDDFLEAQKLEEAMKDFPGVLKAVIDYGKSCLNISYDLEVTNLANIEAFITKSGFTLSNSLGQRLKRSMVHFFEENEYESAHSKPAPCCSHPDEILEKSKKS